MVDLVGKIVEVGTVEAEYVGKLVEMNETEIHLQSESGWIMIRIERVAYLREKNGEAE